MIDMSAIESFIMRKCADGLVHMFPGLDDDEALCCARSEPLEVVVTDDNIMCGNCRKLLAAWVSGGKASGGVS